MMNFNKGAGGFTLAEMMMVVALIAIMSAIAVPAMMQMRRNSDLRAAAYELSGSIQWARSEAAKRNVPVIVNYDSGRFTLPATANNTDCQIVLDDNGNGAPDAGEQVLRTVWLRNKAHAITWNLPSAGQRFFQINPRGIIVMNKAPGNIQLTRNDTSHCYRLSLGRNAGVRIDAGHVAGGACVVR